MTPPPNNVAASVSVIVPAFNDQPGVNACLLAIADQTYPIDRIEVIVVDNGSEPPLSLVETYPFGTRLLRCLTSGSYAARNAGVAEASGQVLAFIDADCWPDAEWLANGVRSLMGGAGSVIIGGEVAIIPPRERTAVALYQWATGCGQEINVREKGFSATANLFCTRRQFSTAGIFDERLLSGGDREWCWRAAKHGICVNYEPSAVVYTGPRNSLRGAVQQARRVTAGRMKVQQLGLTHIGDLALRRQRSAWRSIIWIICNPKLNPWDRLRVLSVASLIRIVSVLERVRLSFGANPERR